jgi:hypothetical protein
MAAANGDVELGLQNGSAGSATGRDSARLRESSVTAAVRSNQTALNTMDAN